jgi:hypothetical protein
VKYRAFRDCETPTKEMIQALIGRISLTPMTNELDIQLNYMDCFEDLKQLLQESGAGRPSDGESSDHAAGGDGE